MRRQLAVMGVVALSAASLMMGTASVAQADTNPPGRCNTDKLLPLPGQADKFIQCSNGIPYVMPCPEGLEFDYKLQICDWPRDVAEKLSGE